MTATAARLDLSIWRNDELYEFKLAVRGLDLTGVQMRAQVRLYPDAPGAALIDLYTVNVAGTEGLRLAGVATVDGVPTSDVRINISKATRAALPYAGEIGDATQLVWVLALGQQTRLVGNFLVLPHTLASDSAPANRPVDVGSTMTSTLPYASATLSVAQDDGATVTIDGIDQVTALLANAEEVVATASAAVDNPRPQTLADANRNRVMITKGGVYQNAAANQVGAIKIKLPVGIDARKMTLQVLVDDQYGSLTLQIVGMNNAGQWNYVLASVTGQHSVLAQPAVRFGNDGTGDCIWIGETSYAYWTALAVNILRVTFTGNVITETWMGPWAISLVTSFETITAGPIVPKAPVSNEFFLIDTGKIGMALGQGAGSGTAASNYNTCVGYYSGNALTTGLHNTFYGLEVGALATTAEGNTGAGLQAFAALTTGSFNTAIGIHAMLSAVDAIGNVAIGGGCMEYMLSGTANVAVGMYAGRDNQGSGNVFLGNHAGMTANGSDKLFIANNENESLIYGDFTLRTVGISGELKAESFALAALNAPPASAASAGVAGQIRINANFIYICTAANTWKRASLATW